MLSTGRSNDQPEATRGAGSLEELINAAYESDRAPGRAESLASAVASTAQNAYLQAAGTSPTDRQDRQARRVLSLMEEDAVAAFDGTDAGEDRDFVVGDSEEMLRAVIVPTRPAPLEGQKAEDLLVVRPGGMRSAWATEQIDANVAEAATRLARPDVVSSFRQLWETREELGLRVEELRSKISRLEEELAQLEEEEEASSD